MPRSCERLATVDWCKSPSISQLHLLWSAMLRTTTSTPYKPTWSTRWSSEISGGRILTSSVWAGSFYTCTRTFRCTAPRSFERKSSWRRNVWSTYKTMTRNDSSGACCRRYTQPPITHIVCQSTKITNTLSTSSTLSRWIATGTTLEYEHGRDRSHPSTTMRKRYLTASSASTLYPIARV